MNADRGSLIVRTIRRALMPVAAALLLLAGCPVLLSPEGDLPGFRNLSDPTNANAAYVGSTACRQCHADVAAVHDLHPHAHALTGIRGGSPRFPTAALHAGVPEPPAGRAWSEIAYVIGGYVKRALFIDSAGFILTTGVAGVDTQWNLRLPANGVAAGFAPFAPAASTPQPFAFSEFAFRTTGPRPLNVEMPQFQENRPGLPGTWFESGVQCEACHGPGGNHFFTRDGRVVIERSRIFVDPSGTQSCAVCHSRPYGAGSDAILVADGFIRDQQQAAELRASGGHARFSCTTCHAPHHSSTYDRERAVRNECVVCHTTENMAGHRGAVFRKGEYVEALTCSSCHMPLATRTGSSARADFAGPFGRIGDTRTHIFRITTEPLDYTGMLEPDGATVRRGPDGRAAVTVDFVCLRCHNGDGLFALTVARAAEIAARVHDFPE